MPALYQAVITKKGLNLRSKAEAGKYGIEFTKAVTGSGIYDIDEELQEKDNLKIPMQEFGFSRREYIDGATSMLQVIVTNTDLEEGYYVREIGVFAMDPDEGEILYSLSLAVDNKWDYLPEYEWGAAMIELEIETAVSNAEKVIITAKMDALASADDLNSLREPEFEDYSMSEEGVPDVEESVQMLRSGKHLKFLIQYIKASLMGLLELGKKLDTGENVVEFEDYSENDNDIPDPEDAIKQVVSGKTEKVFKQYVKASLKGLLNLAQRALSIATGRNQARVFATVAALDAWLAVPANVQQLNVGDNFYITATDVPDYWWDGTQKQKLETQKVDLTTYDQRIAANASAISELNGNLSPIVDSKTANWDGDVMMSRNPLSFDRNNNANNFTKTGIYRTTPETGNASDWGYIETHGYPDWIWQEWHKTSGEICTRRKINDGNWTAWIAGLTRGNLSYTYVNMNERKNSATVGTVSSCHLNYNDFMAVVNFGLFQVSSNLNSEDVEIFTLPDNIFPVSETFFVVTSAHGDVAKCRIRTNRQIVMDRTPGTSIYYGGQAVFFR